MGLLRKLRRRDSSIVCDECKRRDGEAHAESCSRLRPQAIQAAAKRIQETARFSYVSTVLITPAEAMRIRLETKGKVNPKPAFNRSKRRGVRPTPIMGRNENGETVQLFSMPVLSSTLGDVKKLRDQFEKTAREAVTTISSATGKTENSHPLKVQS